jgi:hypothetical protein
MVQNTVWQGSASALTRFQNMDVSKATEADRKEARGLAEAIATGLVSRDGQHVVNGNLRLHVDGDGRATISRQRFWHNSRNDAANALIKKLMTIGYSDRAQDISNAIDNYLRTSGNKFGSQSYFKLVKRHAFEQARSEGAEFNGPLAEARHRNAGLLSRAPRISTEYMDYIEVDPGRLHEDPSYVSEQDDIQPDIESTVEVLEKSQVSQNDDGLTNEQIDDEELNQLVAQRGEEFGQEPSISSQSMSAQEPVDQAPKPYSPPKTKGQRNMERQNELLRAGIKYMAPIGEGGMGTAFSAQLNGRPVVVS